MTEGEEKTPVELAVDLFLYAPIGLLFEGATVLEELAAKGRNQVSMAKVIGRFAVEQGRTEATKAAGRLQDQAAGVLDFIGDSVIGPPTGGDRTAANHARPSGARPAPAGPTPTTAPARASSAHLAIPDYDGLSASQVVNRLAGLSAVELLSVQRYEAANRGRKTILSKIAQLQGP